MLRRSSSHNYVELDQDDKPASDPSSDTTNNVLLFLDSIRRFSFHIAPNAQKEISNNLFFSLDTLIHDNHFTTIARLYNLDFAAAAATIQNYINNTPLQGIVLLHFLIDAALCFKATLLVDNASIKDASKNETSNNNDLLLRLIKISDLLIKPKVKYNAASNQAIHDELSSINHPAAKHMLSYIDFLRSLLPYIEAIKIRLLHIQASLPSILPTKKTKFFSPSVEDWLSNLEAALRSFTPDRSIDTIIHTYELSLLAVLNYEAKKHLTHYNNFRALLDDLTLRDAQPRMSAANRASV